MKQGQTFHPITCDCSFCKSGETRFPIPCQATFKENCQYPKCDCDTKAKVKFNGGRGALLCNVCDVIIREDFDPKTIEDKFYGCEKHKYLDPIQNNCVYGWVLPDRCQYTAHLGCECGAYPPLKWDGEKYVYTREVVHK